MTQNNPILLYIIIANSALRMSNVYDKPPALSAATSVSSDQVSPSDSPSRTPTSPRPAKPYGDALAAKYKALSLLQGALINPGSVDTDVTLATVLLFIECELMESGRDNWACHISGARAIIERLCGPEVWTETSMSPLRRCLISNCLVYVSQKSSTTPFPFADKPPSDLTSLDQQLPARPDSHPSRVSRAKA